MNLRLQKQIIIAVIFFLIIGGIGFLIYKSFSPKPSCFDGILNQQEEKIDCGGPCEVCKPEIKEIQVLSAVVLPIPNTNFYTISARLRNPNTESGGEKVNFNFVLYNDSGAVNNPVASFFKETFILPSETKYILEPKFESDEIITRAEVEIKNVFWQKLKDYQEPRLDIDRETFKYENGVSKVSGVVTNKTNFDFDKVIINAILFDEKNLTAGANLTQIKTLISGEERYFEVSWPWEIKDIKGIKVEAETDIFLQDNFIKKHGTQEKFQTYY